ncbi:hypothetical protein [Mobilicoccus pelagius]|uniref:Integral membrane protein n=1 Tax=Mobilicoccus pelagius NBRC 104925 TaxID=1089455 RepID=H5UT35_9MICO|nr:hypothetical protein [Mobilicoccus pelagius]GAB48893.1 hypothetical protein MOPEL_084_00280 [Mobilicoccus pelagius NBRC 104925]
MQSTAVGVAVTTHTAEGHERRLVGGRAMSSLLRDPAWLGSVGIIVVAGVVHAIGLALAPISIVQPVGVLAIPFAVVVAARRSGRAPSRSVVLAVAVTVLAVAAFVLAAASDGDNAAHVDAVEVAGAALGIGVVAAVLALLGSFGPPWLRCVAWASAGAVVYGLASALLRTDTMLVAQGDLFTWHVLGYTAAILALYGAGGWMIQHAHANGPPAVVLGSLTVVDPVVAVLFGIAFLGEGARLSPVHTTIMLVSGVVAAVGVLLLARHHPEAGDVAPGGAPSSPRPTRPARRGERIDAASAPMHHRTSPPARPATASAPDHTQPTREEHTP